MPVKKATRGKAKKTARKTVGKAAKKPVRRKAAAKTTRKKVARKTTTRAKAKPKAKTKRKPNPAFMRPMQPDTALGAVVGTKPIPRTEITKKIWDYIKANGLQAKTENGKAENAGRFVVADAKLLAIFKNTVTADRF